LEQCPIELTLSRKDWLIETAKALKGSERRVFMARTVRELGWGGQRRAERELKWDRGSIRKGLRELDSGKPIADRFSARGRKKAEEHLPNLVQDMRAIVDSQSQVDPQFRSQRLYRRLSAREVREQLKQQKGYTETELPSERTISTKLNQLGYYPKTVAKTRPKKRFPKRTPSLNKSLL